MFVRDYIIQVSSYKITLFHGFKRTCFAKTRTPKVLETEDSSLIKKHNNKGLIVDQYNQKRNGFSGSYIDCKWCVHLVRNNCCCCWWYIGPLPLGKITSFVLEKVIMIAVWGVHFTESRWYWNLHPNAVNDRDLRRIASSSKDLAMVFNCGLVETHESLVILTFCSEKFEMWMNKYSTPKYILIYIEEVV